MLNKSGEKIGIQTTQKVEKRFKNKKKKERKKI